MHVSVSPYCWNMYLTKQAITEITRQLRNGKAHNGLILANGGVLSYQHAVCLSTQPNSGGAYPDNRALKITNKLMPQISAEAEGEAVIEVGSLSS